MTSLMTFVRSVAERGVGADPVRVLSRLFRRLVLEDPGQCSSGRTAAILRQAQFSAVRAGNIARIRAMLAVPLIPIDDIKAATTDEPKASDHTCPCCGGRMIIIETFARGQQPKHHPTPVPDFVRIDTS